MAATKQGLCYFGSPNGDWNDLIAWCNKYIKQYELIESTVILAPYVAQLQKYWEGEIRQISLTLDMRGTDFQQQVWNELQRIPYGETVTYQHIANQLGKPTAARAVGTAIGKNPVLIAVPCHRVIGSNGKLTGFRGGLKMKQELLELEQACRCTD
ncbi:methylated-DNA--[protein]-cysteine S-methyltransferase [Paenibacillus endoradicis]|uniref:methylated-DNA--[protein]-cysteine S-methyltransferase n=1 Tax=Paenibacillus endoradicis TaxID=2972487 RepID=UPI00358F6830